MGHLVAQAHLLDSRSGVAAADDGDRIALGHRLGNGQRAGSEGRVLEHAHRAVPDDGPGTLDGLGVERRGLRADVAALHVGRDLVRIDDQRLNRRVNRVRERLHADGIDRQQELYALGLGLRQHVLAVVDLRLVEQALADLQALRLEEGEGHAAADDQGVDLLEQVLDDVQLVRDLRAAQDGDERTVGVLQRLAHDGKLLADEVAGHARAEELRDALGGAVRAMAGAERVIHIAVGQGSQVLGEVLDVLGLLLAEAGILQEHDVAVLHRGDGRPGVLAHDVVVIGKHDGLAQVLGEALGHGRQGELGLRAVLRLAQMAAQDHAAAVGDQLLDRRERGDDALVVGDLAVLHRDVEVTAHEHLFAGHFDVVNSLLGHGKFLRFALMSIPTCMLPRRAAGLRPAGKAPKGLLA